MSDAVAWHDRNAENFAARYRHSPAFRERLAVWSAMIAAHARPGAAVLDAGCGPGHLAVVAARHGCRVTALDASPAMLELARAAAEESGQEITFRLGRIGAPDAAQKQGFDLVLCSSVLEYLDPWQDGLHWLLSALRPGGVLLFSLPNGRSLYRHAERGIFRLTGRPHYCANLKACPVPDAVLRALQACGLVAEPPRFYGAVPLLSDPARRLGLGPRLDTLVLYAVRKGG